MRSRRPGTQAVMWASRVSSYSTLPTMRTSAVTYCRRTGLTCTFIRLLISGLIDTVRTPPADSLTGTKSIPQIGQLPGPSRRICGCMLHVQIVGLLCESPELDTAEVAGTFDCSDPPPNHEATNTPINTKAIACATQSLPRCCLRNSFMLTALRFVQPIHQRRHFVLVSNANDCDTPRTLLPCCRDAGIEIDEAAVFVAACCHALATIAEPSRLFVVVLKQNQRRTVTPFANRLHTRATRHFQNAGRCQRIALWQSARDDRSIADQLCCSRRVDFLTVILRQQHLFRSIRIAWQFLQIVIHHTSELDHVFCRHAFFDIVRMH